MDATIISAPSSTKNDKGERDPEMHQTKKGQQYFFGMKLHIGYGCALRLDWGASARPFGLAALPPTL